MRFGWDLDGCAVEFSATVRTWLVEHRGWRPEWCPEARHWSFYEDWGMDVTRFLSECDMAADAGVLFDGDPYPGVIEAARLVLDLGHELHIVTDRNFGSEGVSEELTRRWLDKHGHPYTSLTFSADKTVVPCDVFVEDKPANYAALVNAGVDCFLIDRPWNRMSPENTRAWLHGRLVNSTSEYVGRALAGSYRLTA